MADDFVGAPNSDELIAQLAVAMTQHSGAPTREDPGIPAGYTYLGQFIDHDLTLDDSELDLRSTSVSKMESRRSPTLDLDSLYGDGPQDTRSLQYFQEDGVKILVGTPARVPKQFGDITVADATGYDLPRRGEAQDGAGMQFFNKDCAICFVD